MMTVIPNVLDGARLREARELLDSAAFIDGHHSAGAFAAEVKHNQEVDPDDASIAALNRLVLMPLLEHAGFLSAVLPLRLSGAYFARYTEGMEYGSHLDDAVMGPLGGNRYRSDIAVTIFLNAPDDYRGGELVVQSGDGERPVKLAAGSAVVYPASSLHRVATVTHGERLVAVAWVQSLVRDPARRELLYELDQARAQLRKESPNSTAAAQVDRSYMNLLRMWSEL